MVQINYYKVVFLLDSDCNTGESRKNFTRENLEKYGINVDLQAFFIGTQEFEDSFSDEVICDMANKYFPKETGCWNIEDFQTIRTSEKKFSNELQKLFRTSKPKIGYALGQAIDDPAKVPGAIKHVLASTYEMANRN